MLVDLPEREIVAFARDLIAIPSENPPGTAYDQCVERICAELDALAIDHELVETGDKEHCAVRSSRRSATRTAALPARSSRRRPGVSLPSSSFRPRLSDGA